MKRTILTSTMFVLILAASVHAQDLTPAQFKQLCENSPNNTFTIQAPVKILGTAPAVTAVNSACRVIFAPTSKLEADQASFTFAGPLVFQAGPVAEVALVKSLFVAPSVQITEGASSILVLVESSVQATSGSITIALGSTGKVDASLPFAGLAHALQSAGAISISGASRAAFSLQSTSAQAGTSFGFSFTGPEANFQLHNSQVSALAGPVSVIAPGIKANFDVSSSAIIAATGITLSARGREGHITLSQVGLNAGSGSVLVNAGVGTLAPLGVIKVAESTIQAGGPVTIVSSISSTLGEAVVEVSTINAQGNLRVESGSGGTTTALNNRLTSPTLIRVFAPPSGSCVAENNTAVAPALQLCP